MQRLGVMGLQAIAAEALPDTAATTDATSGQPTDDEITNPPEDSNASPATTEGAGIGSDDEADEPSEHKTAAAPPALSSSSTSPSPYPPAPACSGAGSGAGAAASSAASSLSAAAASGLDMAAIHASLSRLADRRSLGSARSSAAPSAGASPATSVAGGASPGPDHAHAALQSLLESEDVIRGALVLENTTPLSRSFESSEGDMISRLRWGWVGRGGGI